MPVEVSRFASVQRNARWPAMRTIGLAAAVVAIVVCTWNTALSAAGMRAGSSLKSTARLNPAVRYGSIDYAGRLGRPASLPAGGATLGSVANTSQRKPGKNERDRPRGDGLASADDSSRLAKAQSAVRAAQAQLDAAQAAADRLSSLARRARSDANGGLDAPGASPEQNQRRIDASRSAEDAELNAASAKRLVDLAGSAVDNARGELMALRVQVAGSAARAKSARSRPAANDNVGP